jgi:IS30 family transposase
MPHSALHVSQISWRPRKTLGYLTPSEKLAELLAHTA